jgi:Domain of unknown function (DUF4386)
MSTPVAMEPLAEASPRLKATAAGFFWLMTILMGGFGVFAGGRLVVPGDATATAANILAHRALFRWGFTADLLADFCYIAVTLFVYELLKPVSRSLSLLAAFFSLVGCALGALACVLQLAPLAVLGGAPFLRVFTVEQLQALALLFLSLRVRANGIGLVFFGFHCLLIGYLILRSNFLPRLVGVLMTFAGLGWLSFLSPPLVKALYPYIIVPGFLGETSLTLWLLFAGVNVERWNEQFQRSRMR